MRALGLVLAFVFTIGGALAGALTTFAHIYNASEMNEAAEELGLEGEELQEFVAEMTGEDPGDVPSAGRFQAGAAFAGLSILAGLALLVVSIAKKPLIPPFAIALVALAVLTILIAPHFQLEEGDPSTRLVALIAAVGYAVGAGGAFLHYKKAQAG